MDQSLLLISVKFTSEKFVVDRIGHYQLIDRKKVKLFTILL